MRGKNIINVAQKCHLHLLFSPSPSSFLRAFFDKNRFLKNTVELEAKDSRTKLEQNPRKFQNLCQFVSICFNLCQYVSICFNLFQFVSICVNTCQFVSICFNMCQYVSICFNTCQYVSIRVKIWISG